MTADSIPGNDLLGACRAFFSARRPFLAGCSPDTLYQLNDKLKRASRERKSKKNRKKIVRLESGFKFQKVEREKEEERLQRRLRGL